MLNPFGAIWLAVKDAVAALSCAFPLYRHA